MPAVKTTPLQHALDSVEALSLEDQQTLVELIQRRLAERRRDEIARNALDTSQAVREGQARYGSIEDLEQDLLSEP